MPYPAIFTTTARFLGRVGNQAIVSAGASIVAAGCMALPSFWSPSADGSVAQHAEAAAWISPVAADGKIRDRHHNAVGGEGIAQSLSGRGLVTPAAIAMPMNLSWPQTAEVVEAQPRVASSQAQDSVPAIVRAAQALPPRRPSALGDKPRGAEPVKVAVAMPLPLSGAVSEANPTDAPRPPATILGRPVPAPVGYVGSAVSGAADLVGAAGSWTIARAASLVPGL